MPAREPKMPTARVPQIPQIRCTAMAPTGSSSLILSMKATANTIRAPAIPPIMMASVGLIWSAPAVIPTRPPRIPFRNMVRSRFLYIAVETRKATTPPEAAARQVVTRVREVSSGSADSTEPPLKPNQPSQRISTPAVARGMLCPGMAMGLPSLNLPIRAPRSQTATRAAHPPTECTRVDPAKS